LVKMTRRQKYLTLIGFCICYLGTIYIPAFLRYIIEIDRVELKFLRYALFQVFLCTGLLYYIKKIEKRDWSSIGFKKFKGSRDIKWGLIGFGLGGFSFAITGPLVAYWSMESTMDGVMKLMEYPLWFRIGIAIIAGITEEVLFRTYPIERITEWSGNIWIGVVISIILFAGLHIPFWSLGGGIQIGVGTIIWTLIYVKTRSIWAMMIMHVINDLFAFALLPFLFAA